MTYHSVDEFLVEAGLLCADIAIMATVLGLIAWVGYYAIKRTWR